MERRKREFGPSFQCRLTKKQHAVVEKQVVDTGAAYAEVVRRLVADGLKRKGAFSELEKTILAVGSARASQLNADDGPEHGSSGKGSM